MPTNNAAQIAAIQAQLNAAVSQVTQMAAAQGGTYNPTTNTVSYGSGGSSGGGGSPTPAPQTYTVKSGDTLSQIAANMGVPMSSLTGYSSGNPNLIYPGEVIRVGSSVTPAAFSVSGNMGTTSSSNSSTAPILQGNTSDVSAQSAALIEKMKQITSQIKAAQAAGYANNEQIKMDASGNVLPKAVELPKEESIWDKLLGKQQEVQQQIDNSQQNLLDQTNNIYSQWGLTPEKFQEIQNLVPQITDYQNQIADLETRESQAVDAITNRPGVDLAFMSGEQSRITRAYAIQKSGIAAKASILQAKAAAMQGNWDTARQMAQAYVQNATLAQQQYVSDLKWGLENYADIISDMTADERQRIKDQLDYQEAQLKQQSEDYWKQANYDLDVYKAETSRYSATKETKTEDKILSPTELTALGYDPKSDYGLTQKEAITDNENKSEIRSLKAQGKTKAETEEAIKKFLGVDKIPSDLQAIIDEEYKPGFWQGAADTLMFWQ